MKSNNSLASQFISIVLALLVCSDGARGQYSMDGLQRNFEIASLMKIDKLNPVGSPEVSQERNAYGEKTEHNLPTARGKDRIQISETLNAPTWIEGSPSSTIYCFMVVYSATGACNTIERPATSQPDAKRRAQSEYPTGSVTSIDCSHMSDACRQ